MIFEKKKIYIYIYIYIILFYFDFNILYIWTNIVRYPSSLPYGYGFI